MLEGYSFALCLTHDVDRPYKRPHHALFYALAEREPRHLATLAGDNPYWQFERIAALEASLGVRSAFYVLDEPHLLFERPPRAWLDPANWVQHLGRYDPTAPEIATVLRDLDDRGWEIGLHGSFATVTDRERMAAEKQRLETVLGHGLRGVRQHYLRLDRPGTWERQTDLGFEYDASLGSSTDYGFQHGYGLVRPLEGRSLLEFPLTLMESALPDPAADPEAAWAACETLLSEAADNGAVMTVLFHPRYFSEEEFPGYGALYRRLIEAALAAGAWVGSPGGFLDALRAAGIDPADLARPVTAP